MKSGALLSVLGAIGCAGYFGYTYWTDRKEQKAREVEAKATQEALHHPASVAPAGEPGPLPGADPSGPSAGGHEPAVPDHQGPWTLAIPDLTGMTEEQANKALVKAGFDAGKLAVMESSSCHSDDDKNMAPVGKICSQDPAAGAEVGPHSPVTVAIEHDTYEAGQMGSPMEWRRMPKLIGMTEAAARSALSAKGFAKDAFEFQYEGGCGTRGEVCKQHPDPEERAVTARKGTVVVSR